MKYLHDDFYTAGDTMWSRAVLANRHSLTRLFTLDGEDAARYLSHFLASPYNALRDERDTHVAWDGTTLHIRALPWADGRQRWDASELRRMAQAVGVAVSLHF